MRASHKLAVLAIIAVAAPLTTAARFVPAGSRTPSAVRLTVKVIDRNGQAATPVDLQLLRAGSSSTNIDMGSAKSRSVRPGRYNVAAWIPTGTTPHQSFTLVDRRVDLTSSRTITLDARPGKLLRISLDVPSANEEVLEVAPVFGQARWAFNPTTVVSLPVHATYLVPGAVRGMTLYVYSVWEKQGSTVSSPFRYDLVQRFAGGIPAHPRVAVSRSSLAKVNVTVRATDSGQQAAMELSPMASVPLPFNDETALGPTPARLASYRTPGYEWQPIIALQSPSGEIRDNNLNAPAYSKGSFRETYGSAVLAPNIDDMFADVSGRRLQAGQSQFPIQDPLVPTDEGTGITQQLRLFSGGKLLASSHGGTLNVTIPGTAHAYNLRLDATRRPGATLSTQISAVWHFTAKAVPRSRGDASPPIYAIRLLPGGLDLRNQAAPGGRTAVALAIFGLINASPIRLPTVRAWASSDDGGTWSAVRVHAAGHHYVLTVHGPGQAGFVSLRVYARAANGASEELTVIHAYAVR